MRIGGFGAAGRIGQMRVQTILENPRTELVAVHYLSLAAAKSVAGDVPAFDNIE